MTTSTLVTDYLGKGLASARPSSVSVAAGALAIYQSTDTGALEYWTGSAWANLGATPRNQGQMLAQFVLGTVVTNGTFDFTYKAPYPGTITSLDSVSATGTFTLGVKIAGTSVTGLSAVSITSTPTNTTATGANTFTAGQTISGTISSASGSPTNAVLSLNVTWS